MRLGNEKLLFRISCFAFLMMASQFVFGQNAAPNSDISDAEIISERKIPFVTNAIRDVEAKTIDFTILNPENPKVTVISRFSYQHSESTAIDVLRKKMNWQHEELLRQIEFSRVFLNLSPRMGPVAVFAHYAYVPQDVRDEIHRQYALKNKSVGKIAKEAFMRPMSGSLHGFGAQSVVFFVAIGAVQYLQLLTDYAADPLSMVKHLESLTDPIAHASFYAFMAANGFTSDMFLKKYAGVAGKTASTMRLAIPYIGMSAGMIASSLTSEVLNLMKVCASSLLMPTTATDILAKKMGLSDPCELAQKEFFNFNNKVEQYIPMLFSMTAATATLTVAQKGYIAGKTAFNNSQKIAASALFQTLKKVSQPVIQFVGFKLAMSVTPAGWIFHGITIKAAIGSLAQATGFIALDHSINPVFSKMWAQFWRAGSVENVNEKLLEFFTTNQKNNWNLETNLKNVAQGKGRSAEATPDIVALLKVFQEQMDAWRLINHSKYFNGIQIWTSMTSALVRELQASENFYIAFIEEVFNAFKSSQIIKNEGKINDARKWKATYLPFRTFPLYGVKPTGHASCEIDAENCKTDAELNWFNPNEMIGFQKTTVSEVVLKFEEFLKLGQQTPRDNQTYQKLKKLITHFGLPEGLIAKDQTEPLKPELLSKIQEIISKLKNAKNMDADAIGKVLSEINRTIATRSLNDQQATALLAILRKGLGNPLPVMTAGIAIPSMYMSLFPQYFEKLPEKKKNGYSFGTYPEYLFYQMLCGPSIQDTSSILRQKLGFMPVFNPPRLIDQNRGIRVEIPIKPHVAPLDDAPFVMAMRPPNINSLCEQPPTTSLFPFHNLFYAKVYSPGKSEGVPFMNFLGQSISAPILGNWTITSHESMSNASTWWMENTKPLFAQLFAKLDKEFQGLLAEMINGLNSERMFDIPFTNKVLDPDGLLKRTKAGRGLFKSSNQELNTYMTLLAEIEKVQNLANYKQTAAHLGLSKDYSFLDAMDTDLSVRIKSQNEIVQAFKPIYEALKHLRPTEGRIALPFAEGDFKKHQHNTQKAIKAYKEHLEKLKMTGYHLEIQKLSFEGMQRMISQMTAYLLNTQLTNFSASSAYKDILSNGELNSSNNENKRPVGKGANPRGN